MIGAGRVHAAAHMASRNITGEQFEMFISKRRFGDLSLQILIARPNPALGAEAKVVLRKSLEFVRQHRYAFGVRKVPLDGSERALELQAQVGKTDYALTEIDPAADYNLAYVAAPVFRQPEQVAFGLSLVGFDKPLKGTAVAAMGAKLRTVCDRLGDFLAGRAFPMP